MTESQKNLQAVQVLLVEDEPHLAKTLTLSLKKMKYHVTLAGSLQAAVDLISSGVHFQLWILDRNLPDGDGISLLKNLGAGHAKVLILSSKSSVEERILGLKKGADDYLAKPFHVDELKARLEALVRRQSVVQNQSIWTVDESKLQILGPSGWIELTPLEFKVMTYLVARPDAIVSKDRLLRDVWGFTFLPKTRTVDYVLTQLRKRIENDPNSPKHLLTVRGAGIKWLP
jgi:DNA-binding response OmpR family regulator